FLVLFILQTARAQTDVSNQDFWNDTLRRIALPSSNQNWMNLRTDANINALKFFKEYGKALRLGNDDDMRLYKTEKDELGFIHYRFNQYYKRIRIARAEYFVHADIHGQAYAANGQYVANMDKRVSTALTETSALKKVLLYARVDKLLSEEKYWEDELKKRTKNTDTSYYPKGELVWTQKISNNNVWKASNFRLAYQFDVYAASPMISKRIEIDANTGEIINDISLEASGCLPTIISTIWNGPKTININYKGGGYYLWDTCQAAEIKMWDWNSTRDSGFIPSDAYELNNVDNGWLETNQERLGTSSQWAIRNSFDYFKQIHNRNSYDNANGDVNAYINAVFFAGCSGGLCFYSTNNASMSQTGGIMKIGSGGSTNPILNSWGTADIIGHEYTHAVTGASAALTYANESGAINEAFSDIFGSLIQGYGTTGYGTLDFEIGEDRTAGAIRSLSNPNAHNQPDTYNGTFWYTGLDDAGGVHINSGVMNYWYYLVTQGGSGTNDNGASFSVNGLDSKVTADIIYRALTVYLTSSAVYTDARTATVNAAKDLYGNCSNEAYQVANAWYAVGVGTQPAPVGDGGVCGAWPVGSTVNYAVPGKVVSPPAGCFDGTTKVVGPAFTSFTGNEIILQPGFSALSGCNFLAFVTPCTINLSLTGPRPLYTANTSAAMAGTTIQKPAGEGFSATVYPNPASTNATLQLKGVKGNVSVVLTNLQGVDLWRNDRVNSNSISIALGQLPAGMYFINVKDNEHTKVLKLMKK
ncbi:M4 family metallopeptidase, partial [Limnovirga soli]